MLAAARQLAAAGLHRRPELRVVLLLMAGAAQPPLGVRVREVGQTVLPHALRELAHLLDEGRIAELFVLAAGGEVAAGLHRSPELRVVLPLVAAAAEPPLRVRIGKVGHTLLAHALRVRDCLVSVAR
jgi:hypothetical protein